MRVCCDFHDNNCVFGISGSNSCIFQVFSAHTCTIHRILPTKNSKQRPFQVLRKKIRFFEFRQTPVRPPFVNFIHKFPFFFIDGFPKQVFWVQTFTTQSLPDPNFFKPSVHGALRIFRAFASLFYTPPPPTPQSTCAMPPKK